MTLLENKSLKLFVEVFLEKNTVFTTRIERQIRYCTQFDVDTNPYKRNPEFGGCNRVGEAHYVSVSVQVNETQTCSPLPGPQYGGWYVQEIGSDRWQVSYASGVWNVEKVAGRNMNVG